MDKRITQDVCAAARASMATTGIPASITVAQWALESGFGEHQSGKNNCFGIKAVAGQACTTRQTREVIKGKWVTVAQHFADYPSLALGMAAHAHLLATAGIYADARAQLPRNVPAFGAAMAKHYATDPDYWAKLRTIITTNDLYALDQPVPQADPAKATAEAILEQRAAERAAHAADPRVGPTVAPASASRSTGLLAHLMAWFKGRPAA